MTTTTGTAGTCGPYETRADTRPASLCQAVAVLPPTSPAGTARAVARQHLHAACAAAGVELGAYDREVLEWLAGWEPDMAQVVIGLIGRAHAAGYRLAVADDAGVTP